jgi:hypothetical protein
MQYRSMNGFTRLANVASSESAFASPGAFFGGSSFISVANMWQTAPHEQRVIELTNKTKAQMWIPLQ